MEKVEYIRTLGTDLKSVLLIFRVQYECYLSEVMLVFEGENKIRLPQVKVKKGDFIWVTNMDSDEVRQVVSNNSSNTKTWILHMGDANFDLRKFKMVEDKKC